MRCLEYPLDSKYILKKKKSIKRELLSQNKIWIEKKIAVLGGSTTNDIVNVLELFLLNYGIRPTFYESEYGQFWMDAMFPGEELKEFHPDIVYVHTSFRNLKKLPSIHKSEVEIEELLEEEYRNYEAMWEKLKKDYQCIVIQNNFERPLYRLLGNMDISDCHGTSNYVSRLNARFYQYAQKHSNFYINDIDYLSSDYGIRKWSDPFYWHMYKYALNVMAIPEFAYNISNIIKAIYGKNKKAFVLDLDNTLWGGVIGDDGVEGIAMGQEVSMGQAYAEFQQYIKKNQDLGIILNICSKNEEENAIAGLNHPDGILRPDDFVDIKANWDPKNVNVMKIAEELNLGADSFVFVDDNPAERQIVRDQIDGIAVPDVTTVEYYIQEIDRGAYFETVALSKDDLKRGEMYKENIKRAKAMSTYSDYSEYLKSLEMMAAIRNFDNIHMQRIAQLTNKSNQFNLTTRRFSEAELQKLVENNEYICLYGKLEDKFGDNGVVSIVIGRQKDKEVHIILWLMSCRVLKRNMEHAMLDELAARAKARGADVLKGYYYPTAKNKMVRKFYGEMGFDLRSEDEEGNSLWELPIEKYENQNHVIKIQKEEGK